MKTNQTLTRQMGCFDQTQDVSTATYLPEHWNASNQGPGKKKVIGSFTEENEATMIVSVIDRKRK